MRRAFPPIAVYAKPYLKVLNFIFVLTIATPGLVILSFKLASYLGLPRASFMIASFIITFLNYFISSEVAYS
jgi:hypothetical protein